MKLIVGLGNPGTEYERTRHNIGWQALSCLSALQGCAPFQEKKDFHALITDTRSTSEKVLLIKPTTFMNRSGEAIRSLVQFYKPAAEDMLVVQDDMDVAFGSITFSAHAGPAGHNGVASIQSALDTIDVARLRIGIGRPTPPLASEDYVLQPFSREEEERLPAIMDLTVSAIRSWMNEGLTLAMNQWNRASV